MISQSPQKDYKWLEPIYTTNFFSEAALLGQIFHHYVLNSLQLFQVNFRMTHQQDICILVVRKKKTQETNKDLVEKSITFRITIFQIQANVKVHIIYCLQTLKQAHVFKETNYDMLDQFWFNIKSYWQKKIYSSYKVCEMISSHNCEKFNLLLKVIEFRKTLDLIGQNFSHVSPNMKEVQRKQLLLTALSMNFSRIYKYLKAKEYKNLLISQRQIYQVLCSQKNFKILFQQKWGKTGFSLQQKNWVKMHQNKLLQFQIKDRKQNP